MPQQQMKNLPQDHHNTEYSFPFDREKKRFTYRDCLKWASFYVQLQRHTTTIRSVLFPEQTAMGSFLQTRE
jgi:hypothetical protein